MVHNYSSGGIAEAVRQEGIKEHAVLEVYIRKHVLSTPPPGTRSYKDDLLIKCLQRQLSFDCFQLRIQNCHDFVFFY